MCSFQNSIFPSAHSESCQPQFSVLWIFSSSATCGQHWKSLWSKFFYWHAQIVQYTSSPMNHSVTSSLLKAVNQPPVPHLKKNQGPFGCESHRYSSVFIFSDFLSQLTQRTTLRFLFDLPDSIHFLLSFNSLSLLGYSFWYYPLIEMIGFVEVITDHFIHAQTSTTKT